MTTCPRLDADIVDTSEGPRLITADGASFRLPAWDAVVVSVLHRLRRGDLPEALTPQQRRALEPLLAWLRAHSLLNETPSSPLRGWRVRLYGLAPLGARLARGLLRLGVAELTLVPSGSSPLRVKDPLAAVFGNARRDPCPRVRVDPHWTLTDPRIDLAIVAGPGIEPDRVVLSELGRAGVPALVVSAHLGVARVGPLTAPGARGCWRCRDLHIAESDHGWPQVVTALSSRSPEPRPAVAAWAANLALMQLACYRHRGTCDVVGRCVCWDDTDPGLRIISCTPHDACSCAG
ncbi:MAG: hypothetical protein Q3997_08975 [Propionibacteriaceae bacterium]|nr:hypothetical protein [Propionibacteriaceae bacterium]